MKVRELKELYPVVYKVFWGDNSEDEATMPRDGGANPPPLITGYEKFRQIGLALKEKNLSTKQ